MSYIRTPRLRPRWLPLPLGVRLGHDPLDYNDGRCWVLPEGWAGWQLSRQLSRRCYAAGRSVPDLSFGR